MLLTVLHCAYLVSHSDQINFPGWGWGVAGLTEIKANSASQQSWIWGSAELGKRKNKTYTLKVFSLERFFSVSPTSPIARVECYGMGKGELFLSFILVYIPNLSFLLSLDILQKFLCGGCWSVVCKPNLVVS